MKTLLRAIIASCAASWWLPNKWRNAVLRSYGVDCHPNAVIYPGTKIFPGTTLGKGCFISIDCMLDSSANIVLGENVHLAGGVIITTSTHAEGPAHCRAGYARAESVTVGRGSWIGAGAIINPGVTIAEGCVIGAGAVVVKSTEPNGVYIGVPARRVRDCVDGALPPHLS